MKQGGGCRGKHLGRSPRQSSRQEVEQGPEDLGRTESRSRSAEGTSGWKGRGLFSAATVTFTGVCQDGSHSDVFVRPGSPEPLLAFSRALEGITGTLKTVVLVVTAGKGSPLKPAQERST